MEILYKIHSPVVYKNVQLGLLAFGSEIVTFSWLKRKEKYESKMHALLSHVFENKKLQIFYVNILRKYFMDFPSNLPKYSWIFDTYMNFLCFCKSKQEPEKCFFFSI